MKATINFRFLLILMTLLILSNEVYAQSYERRSTQSNSQRSEKVQQTRTSKASSSKEVHKDNSNKNVKSVKAAQPQASRERVFQAQSASRQEAARSNNNGRSQVQIRNQSKASSIERRATQVNRSGSNNSSRVQGNKAVQPNNNRAQGNRVVQPNNNRPQDNRAVQANSNRSQPNRMAPHNNGRPQGNGVHNEGPKGANRPNNFGPAPRPRHNAMPPFRPAPRDRYYGYQMRKMPREARRYHYAGLDYYFLQGAYYRLVNGFYRICRPPVGAILDAAAIGTLSAVTVALLSQNDMYRGGGDMTYAYNPNSAEEYFYQDGIFFVLDEYGQYIVVDAPLGARVPYLPQDYERVRYNGRSYYKVDYTLYRAIRIGGDTFYEVVGNLQLNY